MNAVFKALSDPTRRRVLQLLHYQPMTAGQLAEEFYLSKPTMSGHFTVLRDADLIVAERHGTYILYSLRLSVMKDALLAFAEVFGLGEDFAEAFDVGEGSAGAFGVGEGSAEGSAEGVE